MEDINLDKMVEDVMTLVDEGDLKNSDYNFLQG